MIIADAELKQGDSQDPKNDSTKVCVVDTLKNCFMLPKKELGSLESLSIPETPPDRQHLIRLLSQGLSSSDRGFGIKKTSSYSIQYCVRDRRLFRHLRKGPLHSPALT